MDKKEYHREYHKKWYSENKEKRSLQIKEYGKTHKKEAVVRVQRYVQRHKEQVANYNKKYSASLRGYWRRYRYSAKARGYEMKLTIDDFQNLVNMPCKYCGESEIPRGIDRIDNKEGYTIFNASSCCKMCNMMKKVLTLEDFLNHVKKIYLYNES